MKMRMSQLCVGLCLFGVLAVTLHAGRPPQGTDAKPVGKTPAATPSAVQPPQGAAAKPAAAAPPTAAPQPAEAAPAAPPSTTVNLSPTGDISLQLGIAVNGAFASPFHFTMAPTPVNGLTLSDVGVLSGTREDSSDHNATVTVVDNAGVKVGTYTLVLHVQTIPVVTLAAAPSTNKPAAPAKTTVAANNIYVGGDTISGSLTTSGSGGGSAPASGSTPCTGSGTAVDLKRTNRDNKNNVDEEIATTGCNGAFSYQFNTPFVKGDTIDVSTDAGSRALPVTAQARPELFGEELRAIVGYQQAGASSSNFSQNWFTDFYISRPIIHDRLRWWGNVRVASYPQAGNQTVAETATGLATEVGSLKLNQLAEGGEFLTGGEWHLYSTQPVRGFSENTRQTFTFGFVAGFGATGYFTSPSSSVQVYQVPASTSPQLPAFQQIYGNVSTPYVGLIQPDLPRFQKQYLGGLRLTTRYFDPSGTALTSPPAMVAVTVGQNQILTSGHLTGVIGRFEAFYPLPFGNRGQSIAGAFSSIYLFATAQMRFGGKNAQLPALALGPAPTTVNAYDPDVTLVQTPGTRDVYRVGFGVDLVGLVSQLTGGTAKSSTGNAAPAKTVTPTPAPAAVPPSQ